MTEFQYTLVEEGVTRHVTWTKPRSGHARMSTIMAYAKLRGREATSALKFNIQSVRKMAETQMATPSLAQFNAPVLKGILDSLWWMRNLATPSHDTAGSKQ